MSSPHHSHASLSPSADPESKSYHDIPLDTLVSHLLASKRSLSSINTVWRANEIVTSARASLERSVVLSARTGFLRNGITEQVKILRKVRGSIEGVHKEGQRDFKAVMKTLDAADARLEATMAVLRSTMVEAALRPAEEEPRSLLDFVSEHDVETLRDALKGSIREAQESQTVFDTAILTFDDDLRTLKASMSSAPPLSSSRSGSLPQFPVPENLQALETHAQEMASLLDSLVTHFDLCVNAIRHTEGGFAAVRKAASDLPPGADPVSVSGVMNASQHLDDKGPLSEEDRGEMLTVLENDASQVDDVVAELKEHLAEMETTHNVIQEHVTILSTTYKATTDAFAILESISGRLSSYMMAASEFRMHWDEIKLQIQGQLRDLESMRGFYENYHASYDELLLEIFRRRQSEDKVKSVMRKAIEHVNKLVDADTRERTAFSRALGEYLPNDLWGGMSDATPRWEFTHVSSPGGREVTESPELERSVVDGAAKRDKERHRSRP